MNKKRLILLLVLCGAASGGGWAGWQWWHVWRYHETTDNAYVRSDVTPISAKVAGHVAEIAVADNQAVTAGQVLLRIDDRDYKARVEQAHAAAAAERAEIANLDTRLTVQQTAIASAAAQLSAAEAEVTRARQEIARSQRLARDEFASRQRLDTDQAVLAKAEAARRAAQAVLDGAGGQMEVLRAERQVADAKLWRAEAALAAAEIDLDATVVRSPVDGVIGNRGAQLGQYARPGATLMAVVPLAAVWVDANFKETQIHRLKPGQPAALRIDAFPGHVVPGSVASFSPASGAEFSLLPPENASGNFTKIVQRIPVRIALAKDHALAGQLRPGMSVVVTVETGQAP